MLVSDQAEPSPTVPLPALQDDVLPAKGAEKDEKVLSGVDLVGQAGALVQHQGVGAVVRDPVACL